MSSQIAEMSSAIGQYCSAILRMCQPRHNIARVISYGEKSLVNRENVPAGGDSATAIGDNVPAHGGSVPGSGENAPDHGGCVPELGDCFPVLRDSFPEPNEPRRSHEDRVKLSQDMTMFREETLARSDAMSCHNGKPSHNRRIIILYAAASCRMC